MGPSPTRWTLSGRPVRPWAATGSPSPERPAIARLCPVRLTARRSAVQAASDAQRQLHALVVAAPDTLRGRLRGLTTPRLVSTCGRLRLRAELDPETAATAASLRALARRIQVLDAEIADHIRAITTLVRAWRPDLLGRRGVGSTAPATATSTKHSTWSS